MLVQGSLASQAAPEQRMPDPGEREPDPDEGEPGPDDREPEPDEMEPEPDAREPGKEWLLCRSMRLTSEVKLN